MSIFLSILSSMLGVFSDIFKKIYEKIGITGIIILILIALGGYQYKVIGNKNKVIDTDTITINTLKGDIALQNKAIDTAKKEYEKLQGLVDSAKEENKKVKTQYTDLQDFLKNQPIATTCKAAIDEVRTSAKENSLRWNNTK